VSWFASCLFAAPSTPFICFLFIRSPVDAIASFEAALRAERAADHDHGHYHGGGDDDPLRLRHWLVVAHARARRAAPGRTDTLPAVVAPAAATRSFGTVRSSGGDVAPSDAAAAHRFLAPFLAPPSSSSDGAPAGAAGAAACAWWVAGLGSPSVQGLATVGDLVVAFDRVNGFWDAGDWGVVVGLGPPSAPLAVRMGLGPAQRNHPAFFAAARGGGDSGDSGNHGSIGGTRGEAAAAAARYPQANHGKLIDVQWGRLEVVPVTSARAQAILAALPTAAQAEDAEDAAADAARGRGNNPRSLPGGSASAVYDAVRNRFGFGSGGAGGGGEAAPEPSSTGACGLGEAAALPRPGEAGAASTLPVAWGRLDLYAALGLPADFAFDALSSEAPCFHADRTSGHPHASAKRDSADDPDGDRDGGFDHGRRNEGGDWGTAEEDSDGPSEGGGGGGPAALRKAYRSATRRLHPDKRGGSAAGFQRAVAAFEVLGDASLRAAYDAGADLEPGSLVAAAVGAGGAGAGAGAGVGRGEAGAARFQSFSVADEVTAHYFPARHGFRAFGDPLERRREQEARRAQQHQPGRGRG